jgi:AAA+ ATPase superfamily predicted ATPase
MIKNLVGPPARGDDFYNREELIELVWDYLEEGNNILLAAPRRYGKTSLMYRLIDQPNPGWKSIHVDAESIGMPVNFIIALLDSLMADRHIRNFFITSWKNSEKWLRGLIEEFGVTGPWDVGLKIKLKEKIGSHWQERGEDLLQLLREYKKDKLLIIIDELPVMLHLFRENNIGRAETKTFLYWFRKLRTDPKIGLTNCRFLVGGSIGIENYLSQLGAVDSFNEFQRIPLRELSPECASDFLGKLLKSRKIPLSITAQRKILNLIGTPIPYFIQMFVATIAIERANGQTRIGPRKIEEIYFNKFLSPEYKTYFQHYYDRLRYYDKFQEDAAKAILKELALIQPKAIHRSRLKTIFREKVGESATDDDFNQLMTNLLNDFYILQTEHDEIYVFTSKVLCDWWRRYYAF